MPEASSENRIYVEVTAAFDSCGNMYPRTITWEDGHIYIIDRVLSVRPSFSRKAGGQGDCYTVRICGRDHHLYFEHAADGNSAQNGRWFVERSC